MGQKVLGFQHFDLSTDCCINADWKSFNGATLCTKLVHRTTSRILVGLDLCRNEEYLDVSSRFSRTLFMYGTFWNFVALGPLRRLFAWATIGGHLRDLRRSTDMLLPVIARRLVERGNGVDISSKNKDMLQWIMDAPAAVSEDDDPQHQAWHLMHLTFAASSASGVLVAQSLFQLLMMPEYTGPIREEIGRALEDHGGWTDKALSSMVVLDSFLRETMRMYPAGSCALSLPLRSPGCSSFHTICSKRPDLGIRALHPTLASRDLDTHNVSSNVRQEDHGQILHVS